MKNLLCLFIFVAIIGNSLLAQSSFGIVQYKAPKNIAADETDPSQKVFYIPYENNKYLGIYVWNMVTKNGKAAEDYSYWIKELKSMYIAIGNNYTREPEIVTKQNPLSKWQTVTIKTKHQNIKTDVEENVWIVLTVITKGNKTAAVHFTTNDIDRAKGDMTIFNKNLKVKK
jgi:hypothetical protein